MGHLFWGTHFLGSRPVSGFGEGEDGKGREGEGRGAGGGGRRSMAPEEGLAHSSLTSGRVQLWT